MQKDAERCKKIQAEQTEQAEYQSQMRNCKILPRRAVSPPCEWRGNNLESPCALDLSIPTLIQIPPTNKCRW